MIFERSSHAVSRMQKEFCKSKRQILTLFLRKNRQKSRLIDRDGIPSMSELFPTGSLNGGSFSISPGLLEFIRSCSPCVPYISQTLSWDCGLACVLMVLRAHGQRHVRSSFHLRQFWKQPSI